MPEAPSGYATRSASSAASFDRAEGLANIPPAATADTAMGDDSKLMQLALLSPPSSLLKLTTESVGADEKTASGAAAGLAMLRQPGVSAALRSALHVVGDPLTPLSSEHKNRFAERYIHTRVVVDRHTAGAVLYKAFTQPKVIILRDFPGTIAPAFPTVSSLLLNPPSGDAVAYSFNHHRSRVHYLFMTHYPDTPAAREARAWWDTVNLLPDTGKLEDQSAGVVWTFISRRAKSSLHIDAGDGTCSQVLGRKLWVFALAKEAREHGLVELQSDSMRDDPAGTHRIIDWLACDSFQWCILHEGDTIAHSRDWLHAVCCIGDEDSVSSANYCWLQGTPSLPKAELQPKKLRKRKSSSDDAELHSRPPQPLPIVLAAAAAASSSHSSVVQRVAAAALIADGQTAAAAAAKAAIPVSVARRWIKRLRASSSPEDAPRSGRPRKTDALADAAIKRAAEINPFASNKAIRSQLQLPVSAATVGRRLDDAGLASYFAAMKRHYTDEQRRARLSFANGYKHWTPEQWERVIFSDEVTIEGDGRKRRIRVRRPPNTRFDPQYTQHSQIFTPSRHLFACFCSRGPGFCEMYEGKLDGKALKGLLERTVPETAADYYQTDPTKPGHEEWWLLHDGSPVFRSSTVQTWIFNKQINVLDWPPYSPDLNPIENLWPRVHALMDRLMPTTDEQVADAFVECWPELSLDIFTDFAQSMPARIQAVIDANGDATKY
jgi:transposase